MKKIFSILLIVTFIFTSVATTTYYEDTPHKTQLYEDEFDIIFTP